MTEYQTTFEYQVNDLPYGKFTVQRKIIRTFKPDWLGMFFAGLLGLGIAIIITHMLFGQQLHYWIANMIV